MKAALRVLAAFVGFAAATEFCWKDVYNRGDGVAVHACAPGLERDGLLCYPPCNAGYHGVGPVCWANCEGGMADTGTQCNKQTYGRGVGRPVHVCPPGHEQNGLLCYPNCRDGFHGVGPVCWQNCPGGYHDDGLTCRRDAHIYGKGCCCFFGHCCHGKCPSEYHEDPCTCRKDVHIFGKSSYGRGFGVTLGCATNEDAQGGLCYDKPRAGFTGVGPVAWQNCVGHTKDAGAFCIKETYGRTAGHAMICAADEEMISLFCYKKCKAGYTMLNNGWCTVGCPAGWVDCGAGCALDKEECLDKIKFGLDGDLKATADFVASAIAGAGKAKHQNNIAKVARLASTIPAFQVRLKAYAEHIKKATTERNGAALNDDQAMDLARQATGAVMTGMEARGRNTDHWEESMNYIEQIDPTGVLGSAKTFEQDSCSISHL